MRRLFLILILSGTFLYLCKIAKTGDCSTGIKIFGISNPLYSLGCRFMDKPIFDDLDLENYYHGFMEFFRSKMLQKTDTDQKNFVFIPTNLLGSRSPGWVTGHFYYNNGVIKGPEDMIYAHISTGFGNSEYPATWEILPDTKISKMLYR